MPVTANLLEPVRAVVALGANLGDAAATLTAACEALRSLAVLSSTSSPALRCSSLYSTAPVEAEGPDFVNAVALFSTSLDPRSLLTVLRSIEDRFGRQRPHPNAPRTLDLDLILHGMAQSADPDCTLPHPRAHRRAFVLVPLLELWPDAVLPGQGRADDCLARLPPGQTIEKISGPPAPSGFSTRSISGR